MPTDGICTFQQVAQETVKFGLDKADERIRQLGDGVRDACRDRGLRVVAAPGYEAPGVVVVYNSDGSMFSVRGTELRKALPRPGDGD